MPPDKKIKILHWPTSYPDPARGKPYDCIFVKEHIVSLAPYCQNRVLFTSSDQPSNGKWVEIIATVEDGVSTDRIYFKTVRPLWITNIYIRIVLFFYFLRLILSERYYPNILHIHFHQAGLVAILFSRIFRIKMVVTEHWSAFIGWPELPAVRFQKAAEVFQYVQWVFTVSEKIKKGIEERCGIDLTGKTSVTLNSVDTKIFHPNFSNLNFNRQVRSILAVARLAEEKDLPALFKALSFLTKTNEDFLCQIIGTGDPDQYKDQLLDLGLTKKVVFLGAKPKYEIAQEMRAADVLVVSSFIENSPCVIGEALCTGLPVVSTNVGGIPELLDESNGILVPPREPETLAKALKTALWEREFDRNTISVKAQQHFSFLAIGKQLFDVYQKVIS